MDFLPNSPVVEASGYRTIGLKYTKLFTCLAWLMVFTQFTFVAEANAHPKFAYRIHSSRPKEKKRDEPTFEDDADFEEIPMTPLASVSDTYVDDGNATHRYVESM